MKGNRVFVTGATGFVGGALSLRLADEGASVRALVRNPEKGYHLHSNKNIEIVQGDLTDQVRMHELVKDCTHIFNVAAALGGSLEFQRKANVIGVRNLMEAAAQAEVERVVHISTIAVYGYDKKGEIIEDIELSPADEPYGTSKSEGEKIIRQISETTGLSYTIIRPGAIYGPRSRAWTERFFKIAKRKPAFFLGNGSGAAPIIYIDDLLDLCLIAAVHPAAHKQSFNAVNDPPPTWRQYILEYAKIAGHQSFIGIPLWLLIPPMRLVAAFSKPYSLAAQFLLISGALRNYIHYRNSKARQLLGWQPKTDMRPGVQSCIPWLHERGLLD